MLQSLFYYQVYCYFYCRHQLNKKYLEIDPEIKQKQTKSVPTKPDENSQKCRFTLFHYQQAQSLITISTTSKRSQRENEFSYLLFSIPITNHIIPTNRTIVFPVSESKSLFARLCSMKSSASFIEKCYFLFSSFCLFVHTTSLYYDIH